jgi:4-carboxymuconolactone decarboxylase
MGVTDGELRAIPQVLETTVGNVEAWRVRKALAKVFGEDNEEGRPNNGTWPRGEFNADYAQYFIGNSYIAPLDSENGGPVNVSFEPGCRNNWHIHHAKSGGGQMLICVGGQGWYQEYGKPAVKLLPGTVVNIPANVKHWHGAAADSWMSHLAIEVAGEETSNEWCEPVTDAEYGKLK